MSQIAKNLLLVIMIAGFLEMLLPDSSMRPFVRFTVGLFIIMAVLNPTLDILCDSRDLESMAWEMPWEYPDTTELQEQGVKLNQQLQGTGEAALEGKIEQQVKSLAFLVPGVAGLESRVTLDSEAGQVEKIELVVKPSSKAGEDDKSVQAFASDETGIEDRETIRSKLTAMMENFYGLNADRIVIKFEGG